MNKKVLRDLYLEKRLTLTEAEYNRRNALLLSNTKNFLKEESPSNIHLFLPIDKNKEPDTWPILDWIFKNPKSKAFVSRSNFSDKTMAHQELISLDGITTNRYGIPEPMAGESVSNDTFDLILVPLISFDLVGNRIGYGGGFYDRFLSQVNANCKKIGLSIGPPLDNIDYSTDLDIRLDGCISHLGLQMFPI